MVGCESVALGADVALGDVGASVEDGFVAVAVGGAKIVHRLAKAGRMVLAAVEEEVLKQMGEAGFAAPLVA